MRKIFLLLSVLLMFSSTLMAQTRTVSGVVTTDKGESLPGVTIQVKGSQTTTVTDTAGKYSVNVTDMQTVVLIVRYIGYAYQEQAIPTNQRNADFRLRSEANNLDEVVVVGYGTQKKIHLTGAVAQVNLKTVEDVPTTNLASALRGTLPNVQVSGGNARPGANASITIRNPAFGQGNQVGNSNGPLYIIDDAFRSLADFNLLDQSEVESISILKDAAAAIYGIQGANGVVVVRTKRGKVGAPKVEYSGTLGLTTATQLPSMMSGPDLARYFNDFYQAQNDYNLDDMGINKVTNAKVPGYYTPDELEYINNPANNTNWLKEAWQTAVLQRHALEISGGSDRATFRAGGTYVKQTSNFEGVDANRWTFRASTDAKVANGLKVGVSVSGAIGESSKYFFKQSGESDNDDLNTLTKVLPWQKYYIDGNPVLLTQGAGAAKENINFFAIRNSNNYSLSRSTQLNINANARYDVPFVKGLSLSVLYNKNNNIGYGKQFGTFTNFYQYSGLGTNRHIPGGDLINVHKVLNGDRIRMNPTFDNSYQLNGIINYNRKFGKHDISVMALAEQQEIFSEGVVAQQDGIYEGGLDNFNYAYGEKEAHQVDLLKEYGRLAYAARINYNYASKYLVELAYRIDANTNFSPGQEYGYFPSGSIGWVISEEAFFKRGVKFIDFLKARASIGLLGNDNTKPFQYQRNFGFAIGHAAVFGQPQGPRGSTVEPRNALANPNIRWDENMKTNFGIDAQFLNNRLSLSVDGYFEKRTNVLTQLSGSVPFIIGAAVPVENAYDVNTYGYEISLGWKDRIGKDFTYSFSPFFSWFDGKNITVDQPLGNVGTYLDRSGSSTNLGGLRYDYLGMLRTEADVTRVKNEMGAAAGINPDDVRIQGLPLEAGMLYYRDIRGPKDANGNFTGPDGKITEEDQEYYKRASNNYNLGLNFGFSFKGFVVNAITGISWGGTDYVEGDAKATALGTNVTNRPEFWKDHWTPQNTNAAYPSPFFTASNNLTSAFWERNSLTFRLTNLNVSYVLPTAVTKKLGVGSVRAYFNGQNLFNFYNPYSFRDNGSSYVTYPTLKTYSFGLNVGF